MNDSGTRKWIDRCNIVSRCNKNSIHNLVRIAAKVRLRTDSYLFMVAENCPAHSYTNSLEKTNKVQLSIQLLSGIMHSTVTPQQESVLQKLQIEENPTCRCSIIDIPHFLVFSLLLPAQYMFRFITMAPVYKSEQPLSLYKLENQPFLLTSFSSESLWFNIGHQLALMSFHLSNRTNGHPISNLHYKSRFTHLFYCWATMCMSWRHVLHSVSRMDSLAIAISHYPS
jgi:hypothetical protein